jgi:hypothetical protein
LKHLKGTIQTSKFVRLIYHWTLCLFTYRLAGIDPILLDAMVTFLQKFVDASEDLECDKTPTLHLAVPWLYKLKSHCSVAPSSPANCPTMDIIKKRASELLDNKFCLKPVHYVAAALNPKMKSLRMMDSEPTRKEAVYKTLRDMVAIVSANAVRSGGPADADAVTGISAAG